MMGHEKRDKMVLKKIALTGTRAGVGVTHTGILLAEFLKEQTGLNVAFAEQNQHGDVERLENAVYGCTRGSFTFRGIDYYSFRESERAFNEKRYHYLILDFGVQKKKNQEAIKQCSEKIVAGTVSLWEQQAYLQAIEYFRAGGMEEREKYVVTLGEKRVLSKMEKMLRQKIYFLGYQPLGTVLSRQAEEFFRTLV